MTTRRLVGACWVVLAAAATGAASEQGQQPTRETFRTLPWHQLAGELREALRLAIDPPTEPPPTTEAEAHARLGGLLDDRPLDPWGNPLAVEVAVVTKTAERQVSATRPAPPPWRRWNWTTWSQQW